jgi:hypothetical protein
MTNESADIINNRPKIHTRIGQGRLMVGMLGQGELSGAKRARSQDHGLWAVK